MNTHEAPIGIRSEPRVISQGKEDLMARDRPLTRLLDFALRRDTRREHQNGQGLAEYALILSLIAVVAISMLITLGQPIQQMLSSLGQSM
jgi:Flp pilus assembly pilin Flp